MVLGRAVILISLLARVGVAQPAASRPARLIDMHVHAWDSLPTGRPFRDSLLAAFDAYHLERAVVSGALTPVRTVAALAPDRVLAGVSYGPGLELPAPEILRREFRAGRLAVFGEIDAAWLGEPLAGARLSPYWELSQATQVPVAVFTGLAPAGTALRPCCTHYRATAARLQDVEEALVRHPKTLPSQLPRTWRRWARCWKQLICLPAVHSSEDTHRRARVRRRHKPAGDPRSLRRTGRRSVW